MYSNLDDISSRHPLARIDARVKIMVCIVLLAMILSHRGFLFPIAAGAAGLSLCIWLRVPARTLALRFSEPVFVAGIIILLKFLFFGKEILFSIKALGITITGHRDGLMEGLLIACRLVSAVLVVSALAFSAKFVELLSAIAWLRLPKAFIEVLLFAYRAVFVLFEDAQAIYRAQKNRLGYSSIRRGLGSFGVLAGSLTLKAFDHSEAMTRAMVQRGFDGGLPPAHQKDFCTAELFGAGIVILSAGMLWMM